MRPQSYGILKDDGVFERALQVGCFISLDGSRVYLCMGFVVPPHSQANEVANVLVHQRELTGLDQSFIRASVRVQLGMCLLRNSRSLGAVSQG